ncbi:MAG: hypothetical protein LPK45_11445, partial [Bacteroidota bacterium]|nr:hypothetical protein [Bacteroidota bacterium]MDX5431721.1 hypothetical protein [Bacteroidota bacterium]MDX5470436.1 hypothetical protein [Bacteroidota bacterium]
MNRQTAHKRLNLWLWIGLAMSLPISLKLPAVFLAALLLNSLLEGQLKDKWARLKSHPWILLCTLPFFAWLAVRTGFDSHFPLALKITERKTAFLLLPLLLGSQKPWDSADKRRSVQGFLIAMLFVTVFCIIEAFIQFTIKREFHHFFYHNLGRPFDLHAVYFSALCLIVMVLIDTLEELPFKALLKAWFIVIILLLSSKLFIL